MRIYFAGSITGGREDAAIYAELVEHLGQYGTVVTEHIGKSDLTIDGESIEPDKIYCRDIEWLDSCDVLVADVTVRSLGVGYEIGRAVARGQKVLCLHRPAVNKLSAMISGCNGVAVREYHTATEAKQAIDKYFSLDRHGGTRKVCTLCIVQENDRVLLGMKKRGFGQGKWNGFGGKVQPDEDIQAAAQRELEEEAGITATLEHAGTLVFSFEKDPVDLEVHIFCGTNVQGEPVETDEMKPQWYATADIPYEHMWPDDKYWLPVFLAGKKFSGRFHFAADNTILKNEIKEE
jgi:8-oxo-dGTP diphosphatase / 2-hydroxy-dATP diphosphatase